MEANLQPHVLFHHILQQAESAGPDLEAQDLIA